VPSVKTGCLELATKIIGLHSSHTSMCSAVFPPFPPPIRFDYEALDDNYRVRITNKFAYLLLCEEEWLADDLWNAGKEIIIRIAAETIDKRTKKHTTWISDETFEEIKIRREIKSRRLDSPIGKALCRN